VYGVTNRSILSLNDKDVDGMLENRPLEKRKLPEKAVDTHSKK